MFCNFNISHSFDDDEKIVSIHSSNKRNSFYKNFCEKRVSILVRGNQPTNKVYILMLVEYSEGYDYGSYESMTMDASPGFASHLLSKIVCFSTKKQRNAYIEKHHSEYSRTNVPSNLLGIKCYEIAQKLIRESTYVCDKYRENNHSYTVKNLLLVTDINV